MELDIFDKGKEYISASRAAEKLGYASDYIGQLCRAGKVPGRLIGRTWYVDLPSLAAHKASRQAGKKKNSEFSPLTPTTPLASSSAIAYEADDRPLLPELIKFTPPPAPRERRAARDAVAFVLSLTIALSAGFATLDRTSPVVAEHIENRLARVSLTSEGFARGLARDAAATQVAAVSFFNALSESAGFITESFRTLREMAFGSPAADEAPLVFPRAAPRTPLASTDVTQTLDAEALKGELQASLESYIQTQISGLATPAPRIVYQTSSPTINTTVIREEILLADTRPTVTRQSSSDVDTLSRALTRLRDGTTFTNSSVSGTFSGTADLTSFLVTGSSTLQNLTFTNATGTNATTTNLYVSGRASTTDLRSNTGNIGNLTSTFGALTNLLVNGSTTLQNFSAQYASTTQIGSTGNAYFATSGGNVGIGTTNPDVRLVVRTASGASGSPFKVIAGLFDRTAISVNENGVTTFDQALVSESGYTISGGSNIGYTPTRIYFSSSAGAVSDAGLDRTSANTLRITKANAGGYGSLEAGQLVVGSSYGGTAAPANGALFQGNVGIGATNPGAKLQLNDGSVANDTNTQISMYGGATNRAAGTEYANIFFGNRSDSGSAGAKISVLNGSSVGSENYGTQFAFSTSYGTSASTLSERIRLNSSGFLGIGTTTPIAYVDISPTYNLGNAVTNLYGERIGFTLNNPGQTVTNWFGNYIAAPTVTAGTLTNKYALVTEANAGNVGVGTTTPETLLHLYGINPSPLKLQRTSAANSNIQYTNTVGSMYAGLSTAGSFGIGSAADLVSASLTVLSTGNVGIGTIDPTDVFEVEKNQNTSTSIKVENTTSGTGAIARFDAQSASSGLSLLAFDSAYTAVTGFADRAMMMANSDAAGLDLVARAGTGDIRLYTGALSTANERMRIDSSGNIGIGTTNPGYGLHLYGTTANNFSILTTQTTQTSGTNVGFRLAGGASNATWLIGTNRGDLTSAADDLMIFKDAGTTGVKLTIKDNGNVGIGTTGPLGKLQVVVPSSSGGTTTWGEGQFVVGADGNTGGVGISYNQTSNYGIIEALSPNIANRSLVLNPVAGNIGIGTTTPRGLLGLNDPAGTDSFVVGSATPKFIIKDSGNIGIGTTNPGRLVEISGSNDLGVTALRLTNRSSANVSTKYSELEFTLADVSTGGTLKRAGAVRVYPTHGDIVTSNMDFYVTNASSDNLAMRLQSNGFVGIGTTAPRARLDVSGDWWGTGKPPGAIIESERASLVLRDNTGTGNGSVRGFLNDNASLSLTRSVYTADDLGFDEMVTDMIIDSTGNVGIGTTSPWAKLSVAGRVALPNLSNNGTGYYACVNTAGGGAELATSTTACGASSIKYKENVADLTYGLSEVLAMRPVSFDWKQEFMPDGTPQIGFIAEEVETLIPEIIGRDNEGSIMNLDYAKLTSVLTRAIQDIARITGAFKDNLIAWMGDAANGIQKFFAREVHTEKLCVKKSDGTDVCVTGDELAALMNGSPSTSSGSSTGGIVTTTPPEEEAPPASETPAEEPQAQQDTETEPVQEDVSPAPEEPPVEESVIEESPAPAEEAPVTP